jgi:hypothetical protein
MTRLLLALLLAGVAVAPLSVSAQDKKAEMKPEPATTKAEAKKDEPKKASFPAAS